ncbi:hypothetical protein J2T57_001685 [Natronocella acetinitrilica]|uniref:Uncharacterized protein n=1 Tax=Natronocella acetinitrilica TaxID=414046 RepID=A0AAE3KC67_9GAMM|nr:hypothetical protein [Natronocella acetinitrilica]MCP1674583.1 hypothetical protein [Natronocella acetinitrilica]
MTVVLLNLIPAVLFLLTVYQGIRIMRRHGAALNGGGRTERAPRVTRVTRVTR